MKSTYPIPGIAEHQLGRSVVPILVLFVSLAVTLSANADYLIGSPEMAPSRVDPNGGVLEAWGAFQLKLEDPAGAQVQGQDYAVAPVPTVTTKTVAGPVNLVQTVYRAPIWPGGADVLSASLENTGSAETAVRLSVSVPEQAGMGECVAVLGGQPILALPLNIQPDRRMKEWGCTGGVVAMSGWATPEGECDPAFKNISAGMGGVPIEYRFAVPANEKRTVVLGFCESFYGSAGQRPLLVSVEGTPDAEIDPLKTWGRHIPGCLAFDAVDTDGDGYLKIVVSPAPNAPDKNPILNAVWVFKSGTEVDLEAVKRGAKSSEAEHYVDVGGANDQTLYENGPFTYNLTLKPAEKVDFTFLLASPGGSVPNPADTAWTPATMAKAAKDVWRDWFGQDLLAPEAEATRQKLAAIILSRAQAGGFFAALPEPGNVGSFSFANAAVQIAALDDAGKHNEAERMLRLYWDKPLPEPFASLGQADNGQWKDPVNDPCAQAYALEALARHATVTADKRWTAKAWPAIKASVDYLASPEAQAALTPEAKQKAAIALADAVKAAELLGNAEAAAQFKALADQMK